MHVWALGLSCEAVAFLPLLWPFALCCGLSPFAVAFHPFAVAFHPFAVAFHPFAVAFHPFAVAFHPFAGAFAVAFPSLLWPFLLCCGLSPLLWPSLCCFGSSLVRTLRGEKSLGLGSFGGSGAQCPKPEGSTERRPRTLPFWTQK